MHRAENLTDNEGTLLGLVERVQPVTTYQISRIYDDSPVSNFNTSKGKLYPLIKRLTALKLLRGEKVENDRRGSELLYCTSEGKEALRVWLKQVRPQHLLLEDPLRTKVQSFNLLSNEDKIQWVATMRSQLLQKLEELEKYGEEVTVPYQDLVHANAVASIESRLSWLDKVLLAVKRDS
jgi:DNA-binding PadR family transcriptional regulator